MIESSSFTSSFVKCYRPRETARTTSLTRSAFCNTTTPSYPTTHGTNIGNAPSHTSSWAPPPATCTLNATPPIFYLSTSQTGFVKVNSTNGRLISPSGLHEATTFHIRFTNDGSITGIPQLALFISVTTNDSADPKHQIELGAWVSTADVPNSGSAVQIFSDSSLPPPSSGYGIVTASFSTYLCQLSLITWMYHDLSYPQICDGELRLGFGLSDVAGCERAVLKVTAA